MSAVVLLSGGWDSAYCALVAVARHDRVFGFFADYGQPYLAEEVLASSYCAERLGLMLVQSRVRVPGQRRGVLPDRNRLILEAAVAACGPRSAYYFGCRNPLATLDRFKDSNRQWASVQASRLGIVIRTPALLVPKAWIRWRLSRALEVSRLFSSEGFVYAKEAA